MTRRTLALACLAVLGCTIPAAAQLTPQGTHRVCTSAQSLVAGQVVFPCQDIYGSGWVVIKKSDGTDVTYLASVTEASSEPFAATVQPVSSYMKVSTGSAWARLLGASTGELYVAPKALNASATLSSDIVCENSKIYDASTSGNTELVAISGTKHIYICGYEMLAAGTVNLSLVAGTGTACASAVSGTPSTGTSGASAALTPAWQFTTQTGKLSAYPTHGWLLDAGAGNAVCFKASGATAAQVQIWYSQR